MKKFPTDKEWFGYERDLDASYAYKVFFGKTNDEMQSSFKLNVIERTDEIRFMPVKAFQYYIFGLRDYVMKRDFGYLDSSDAASCFIGLVLEKLENEPSKIIPVLSELIPSIEFVSNNQNLYEASEEIYGNFKSKYKRIIAFFTLVRRSSNSE
ncbi:hypothetical protein DO97_19285 [Neosynechococcus sphagnicola sy1]|uniref:Uncharacterized protein n=1 Tax=Neosynechococcus sphagnicola sy1 TaxID=1497020 RepID=A0A098THM0_9CYAN|nr:hypothetical protein [Neosynechococcus sphagnicola]KGF71482.1 hypothetical protein DO97_19285 [Neosynechococcus sphagnicola sy1]